MGPGSGPGSGAGSGPLVASLSMNLESVEVSDTLIPPFSNAKPRLWGCQTERCAGPSAASPMPRGINSVRGQVEWVDPGGERNRAKA